MKSTVYVNFLLLSALAFLPGKTLLAQPVPANPPDCLFFINIAPTGGGSTTPNFDNRTIGCDIWTISYQVSGTGTVSLDLQYAPGLALAPGVFTSFTGTQIVTGVNPNTNGTTGAMSIAQNNATGTVTTVVASWLRVVLTGTFSGRINGVLYGYKSGYGGGGGTSTPCPGTLAVPCIMGGKDGSGVARDVITDSTGRIRVVGGDPVGSIVTGDPVGVGIFSPGGRLRGMFSISANPAGSDGNNILSLAKLQLNGTTWDPEFYCTTSLPFSVTGTDVLIATGAASTTVRMCHMDFSLSASATVTIRQGTQTTTPCDTNTVTIAGPYPAVTAMAMDYGFLSSLTTTVAARDICLHFSASVTAGGFSKYARF